MSHNNFYRSFVEYYPEIFPFSPKTYEFLREFTPHESRRILDAGCGTGDYAAQYQKDGFKATGFDLDENMIHYARSHFPDAEFFCLDLRDITRLNNKFDMIFSIGNTVSHLPQAEFLSFAADVFQILNPGGRWIFQVKNWDHIFNQAPEYQFPVITAQNEQVKFFRRYASISPKEVTFLSRLEDRGEVVFQGEVKLHPIRNEDYLTIHHRMGFKLSGHFADFSKAPYDKSLDSANIFIFTKPSNLSA
ncbi:MAG: class I SAM-dependent methyltransferase [Candidatus Aminicenantes bacterium]